LTVEHSDTDLDVSVNNPLEIRKDREREPSARNAGFDENVPGSQLLPVYCDGDARDLEGLASLANIFDAVLMLIAS
jgi:hypothetical protein